MHGVREAHIALRVALLLVVSAVPILAKEAEEFPLEESSVFEDPGSSTADPQVSMIRYQAAEHRTAMCGPAPVPDVVYPKLRSRNPLYGYLPLGNAAGDQVHFVVDESEPEEDAAEQSGTALLRQVADLLTGSAQATPDVKREYDLLYVDTNGDRNLTNDAPLRPMKEPPKVLVNMSNNRSVVVFDYLEIKPLGDSPSTARPVRFVPWLNSVRAAFPGFQAFPVPYPGSPMAGTQQMRLIVTPTAVRTGRIRLGNTWYQAMLGIPISGPATRLLVKTESSSDAQPGRQLRWRQMPLGRQQAADGFYDVAVSPSGDRITVGPYRGPMGEFRVDPGYREVEQFGASGLLQTSTGSTAWIGEPGNYYPAQRPRSCELPVGDYRIASLTVACGDLLVSLSPNARRVQMPGDAAAGTSAFPVAIREGQPFRMRFSDQPTMMFVSPPEKADQLFRRGTTISIQALLLDPSLDCIIRGLNDTTKKLQEQPYPMENGEIRQVPVYASLVPQVSIANAAGKEVASGVMPFG